MALKRAQKLMEKYGVSADDVRLSEIDSSRIFVGNTKKPSNYLYNLASMIKGIFGCHVVFNIHYDCMTGRYVNAVFKANHNL